MLGAVGSHLIDYLTWITGRRVVSVNAVLQSFVKERKDGSGEKRYHFMD